MYLESGTGAETRSREEGKEQTCGHDIQNFSQLTWKRIDHTKPSRTLVLMGAVSPLMGHLACLETSLVDTAGDGGSWHSSG